MHIIAITVSVNYDDILTHTIKQNARFFSEWVIVTSNKDQATKAVIKKSGLSNITILYFNKFKINAFFNKGGAILFAQNYLLKKYNNKSPNVLLLDSDIILPDNFKDVVSGFTLENDTIYGVSNRYDYHSFFDFLNDKKGNTYWHTTEIVGFFQLYKLSPKYKYRDSVDCGGCDSDFRVLFPKSELLNLSVSHLGKDSINWRGRDKNVDNIFSKCLSKGCRYFINTDISKKIGLYCCNRCKNGLKDHGYWCQKKY